MVAVVVTVVTVVVVMVVWWWCDDSDDDVDDGGDSGGGDGGDDDGGDSGGGDGGDSGGGDGGDGGGGDGDGVFTGSKRLRWNDVLVSHFSQWCNYWLQPGTADGWSRDLRSDIYWRKTNAPIDSKFHTQSKYTGLVTSTLKNAPCSICAIRRFINEIKDKRNLF